MRLSRFSRALGICLLALAGLTAWGQERFRLSTRAVAIPENGTIMGDVVATARHEFSFISPAGWQRQVDRQKKTIQFTHAGLRASLELSISFERKVSAGSKLRYEDVRGEVIALSPAAEVVEEFPCYTSGEEGLAVDFVETKLKTFRFTTRLAMIPYPGGTLRLRLSSPSESFADLHGTWSHFVNSLTVAETSASSDKAE